MSQVLLLQSGGRRVPVSPQIFKHGGGIYLAWTNAEANVHIPLLANAADMIATLRQAADLVEQAVATRDQGHVSRSKSDGEANRSVSPQPAVPAPIGPRLNPNATSWEWLTPEMVISYFEQSPVVSGMVDDVRAALKSQIGLTAPATEPGEPVKSQLETDLEAIAPHLEQIMRNGKANKSEIARRLNIAASGHSNWSRLIAIAAALEKAA